MSLKTLVLNDDYIPLNIIHWKRAMKRILGECLCTKCNGTGEIFSDYKMLKCSRCDGNGYMLPARAVEYYDEWIRDSMGREYPIPAVITNQHHIKRKYRKVPFSRRNILRRDKFTCQYCGQKGTPQDLTLDHVVPRSMWRGKDTPTCWKNIVTSCVKCNRKKGDKTPEQAGMQLRKNVRGNIVTYKKPKQPSYQEIALRLYMRDIPQEWVPYIQTINKDL